MKKTLRKGYKAPTPAPKPQTAPAAPKPVSAPPNPPKAVPATQPGAYTPKPANAAYVLAEMLKLSRKR